MNDATALRHIREHLASLGIPTDDVTDDELRDSIRKFGEAARKFGVTTAEFVTIAGAAFVAAVKAQEDA